MIRTCPASGRAARERESGAVLVVGLLVIASLMTLSVVSVTAVRTGSRSQASIASSRRAMFVAQAGVAAASEHLRANCDRATGFTALLGTRMPPSAWGGGSLGGSFEVRFENNPWDPSGSASVDSDGEVLAVVRARTDTGAGVMLNVHLRHPECMALRVDSYGQKNMGPMGEMRTARRLSTDCVESQAL